MNSSTEHMFNPTSCLTPEQLSAYAAGKLGKAELRAVEEHLADCEMCSDELEGLLLISPPEKIDTIVASINSAIDMRTAKHSRGSFPLFFKIAATIILIGGLAAVLMYEGGMGKEKVILSDNTIQETTETEKSDAAVPLEDQLIQEKETGEGAAGYDGDYKNKKDNYAKGNAESYPAAKAAPPVYVIEESESVLDSDDAVVYYSVVADAQGEKKKAEDISDAEASNTVVTKSEVALLESVTISDNTTYRKVSRNERKEGRERSTVTSGDEIQPGAPASEISVAAQTTGTSGGVISGTVLNDAVLKAQSGAYAEAIILFDTYGVDASTDINHKFYYALSLYKTGKFDKAHTILKKLERDKVAVLYNDIQWYYALSLVALNKKSDAEKVLNSVIQRNSPYAPDAQKELDKMK